MLLYTSTPLYFKGKYAITLVSKAATDIFAYSLSTSFTTAQHSSDRASKMFSYHINSLH